MFLDEIHSLPLFVNNKTNDRLYWAYSWRKNNNMFYCFFCFIYDKGFRLCWEIYILCFVFGTCKKYLSKWFEITRRKLQKIDQVKSVTVNNCYFIYMQKNLHSATDEMIRTEITLAQLSLISAFPYIYKVKYKHIINKLSKNFCNNSNGKNEYTRSTYLRYKTKTYFPYMELRSRGFRKQLI